MIAAARERLAHLPRDTRDTLFQLCVIGWTIAPHLLHLATWCAPMGSNSCTVASRSPVVPICTCSGRMPSTTG